VELVTHFEGSGNPYIVWKNGVHRSSERERVPFLWYAHPRSLAARVNSCIRSAGAHDCESFSTQPRDGRFENALDRPLAGLSLPAGKARAIVVQHELHGSRQHRVKLSPDESLGKERNLLKMIDFRVSARQCGTADQPRSLSLLI
jgi:hypothetical protein